MTRTTARIILINALFILALIAAVKTFAQPNGNFKTMRLKKAQDTATFSPQPAGTMLFGNQHLYFKYRDTLWQEIPLIKAGSTNYWKAQGATAITTPTVTGSWTLIGNHTLTGNLTGTGDITRTGNMALTGNITGSGDLTRTGTTILTGYTTVQSGQTTLAAGTVNYTPLQIVAGTLKTSPISGGVEYDGTYFYGTTSSGRYISPSMLSASYTHDFGNVAAGANETSANKTLTGVDVAGNWVCSCDQGNYSTSAGFFGVAVSGTNTVTITFNNAGTIAVNPPSYTYNVICIKK